MITSAPAVVKNLSGRLEVFARGADNTLWRAWQVYHNGPWSNWSSFTGIIASAPTVAKNSDGRIEVFVLGLDKALWHLWQTTSSTTSPWTTWAIIGGITLIDASVIK
ncbi:hypothetical protein [Photorhabdus hainanensis]|uniref:hypothetical protein n=1 Tax=Photorhabdus hainanensis TaxID=1004166 RepID=UPI0030EF983A